MHKRPTNCQNLTIPSRCDLTLVSFWESPGPIFEVSGHKLSTATPESSNSDYRIPLGCPAPCHSLLHKCSTSSTNGTCLARRKTRDGATRCHGTGSSPLPNPPAPPRPPRPVGWPQCRISQTSLTSTPYIASTPSPSHCNVSVDAALQRKQVVAVRLGHVHACLRETMLEGII